MISNMGIYIGVKICDVLEFLTVVVDIHVANGESTMLVLKLDRSCFFVVVEKVFDCDP